MASGEPPSQGLQEKKDTATVVGERMAEKMGTELPKGLVPLPFESTLAYAFRLVGGKQTAIEGCRLLAHQHPEYEKIVFAYDNSSQSDKDQVRLEDLCAAAEISPSKFIGDITGALHQRNYDIGKLIVAANHEKVIGAAVLSGMDPSKDGHKDRQMLLETTGFVRPRGPLVQVSNNNTVNASASATADSKSLSISGLPSFESESIESATMIRGDAGTGALGHYTTKPKQLSSPEVKERIPMTTAEAEAIEVQAQTIEAEFEDN